MSEQIYLLDLNLYMVDSKELVNSIIEGIQELKGKGIVSIDLTEIDNCICSYFVVCNGDSNTHVNSIANSVVHYVHENNKDKPIAKDGFENSEWVALDYGDVIVHVFQRHAREYYNLEGLWEDGKVSVIEDLN